MLLRLDGAPAPAESLEAMLQAMGHRGPDGRSVQLDGSAALGVLLHRTVPEAESAAAPLRHPESGKVLVADGRIDNRSELIGQLRLPPDCSDEAVLLAALQRWGDEALRRVIGDTAFALWDAPRRTLLCGRDVMGQRPLYYLHERGKVLAVATEIKALLAVATSVPRLNERRIARYVLGLPPAEGETAYRGIQSLPPGCSLLVRDGELTVRRVRALQVRPQRRSDADALEGFGHLFNQAVGCRLRTSVGLGFALSGGLDSSAIVGAARRLSSTPLRTFSFVFPGTPKSDERPYIDAMVESGGMDAAYVEGDSLGPLTLLEHLAGCMDEPLSTPNLHLHWLLFSRAREVGAQVFIDGFDGDTVVSHGGLRICELLLAGRLPAMVRELRATAARRGTTSLALFRRTALSPLWRTIRPRIPIPPRRSTSDARSYMQPDFARSAAVDEILHLAQYPPALSVADDQLRRLTSGWIVPTLETANHSSAVLGVECRFPFQDVRLVEYCLSLASGQKLRDGWDRWILRQAMGGSVPEAIQWRKNKSDLSHAFHGGLLRHDAARASEMLNGASEVLAPFVDLPRLQAELPRQLGLSRRDAGEQVLWRALALSAWLRRGPWRPP